MLRHGPILGYTINGGVDALQSRLFEIWMIGRRSFLCSEANFSFCRPRKKDVGIVVEQSTANQIGMIRYQQELYFLF
jgi:hypothetical protein